MAKLRGNVLLLGCLLLGVSAGFAEEPLTAVSLQPTRGEIFDAVWTTTRDDFFDPQMRGVDWDEIRDQYRAQAIAAENDDEFAVIVNQMLGRLETSHTHYFTPADPRYYQILAIFRQADYLQDTVARLKLSREDGKLSYDGIGLEAITTDEGVFVSGIYAGLPAEASGLLVGDQILSVDGEPFHPIHSFAGKAGQPVSVSIRRQRGDGEQRLKVTPVSINAVELFVDVMRNSIRIIEFGNRRIGYVHAWSYAGQQYQDVLQEELLNGRLANADALVLDLRDGWGGASPDYLNLFNDKIPALSMKRRGEPASPPTATTWRKPTALLINDGVRSGKEVFVLGFKQMGRGPVVGTRTGGAVVGGSPRLMPDDSILYLAVVDAEVDGVRLEGVGVPPTIEVQRPIPYSAGADPQLDAAVKALHEQLSAAPK